MCDLPAILGLIALAQIGMIAAIALTVVAIAANSSFFAAPTAPVPFGLALVATAGAAGALGAAAAMLGASECQAGGKCAAEALAAMEAIRFITLTLTATAILGVVAFVTSAVPWVGAISMAAYSAGLVIAAVGIGPATNAVAILQRCIENAKAFVAADVLVVTGYVVGLFAIGFGLIILGMGRNSPPEEKDPFGD